MRGIAALFVVARHFGDLRGAPQGQFSYLAVDIFFLLSGFVISFRYTPAFAAGLSSIAFMKRRIVRLYPLFAVGIVLGLIPWTEKLLDGSIKYSSYFVVIATNSLMLPAPTWRWIGAPSLFPLLLPAWSLFFELYVANLIFTIGNRNWKPIHLATLVLISGVGLLSAAIVYGSLDLGGTWPTLLGGTARVGFSFFAGVLLQHIHATRPPQLKLPSWFILIVLSILLSTSISGTAAVVYECLCVFAGFPALVFWGAEAFERRPWLGKALGDSSFALYTIHYPMISMLKIILIRIGIPPSFWIEGLFIAAMSLTAFALHRFYDIPVGRLLKRKMA